MIVMNSSKWYQCGYCPAAFDERSALKKHSDGHAREGIPPNDDNQKSSPRSAKSLLPSLLSLDVDSDDDVLAAVDEEDDGYDNGGGRRIDAINDCVKTNDSTDKTNASTCDYGASPAKKLKFSLVSDDGEYTIPMSQEKVIEFVNIARESKRRRKREDAALAAFKDLFDYEPQSLYERWMIADWSSTNPLKVLDVNKIQNRNVMLCGNEVTESYIFK